MHNVENLCSDGLMATELITTTRAAALLGVHRVTVVRWCHAGRLTYTQVGRDFLIDRAEVETLVSLGETA